MSKFRGISGEILALVGGMLLPLLMSDLVTRLYVAVAAGFVLLLANIVLLWMRRRRLMQLSGLALAGIGLALCITPLGEGFPLGRGPEAYLVAFTGVIVFGIGYLFVHMASRRSRKVC